MLSNAARRNPCGIWGRIRARFRAYFDSQWFDPDEVIKRHYKGNYLVYFIGFSIGFPYFGGMDDSISTPRLDSPRKSVPSGSIGIAGNQTGVYPLSSPGGWNLIGRTPMLPFNVKNPENSVIKMGSVVRFVSISSDEFKDLIE